MLFNILHTISRWLNENNYQIVSNYSTTVEDFSLKSKDLFTVFWLKITFFCLTLQHKM